MLKTKKNDQFNPKKGTATVFIPGHIIEGHARKALHTAGATFFTFSLNTVGLSWVETDEQFGLNNFRTTR